MSAYRGVVDAVGNTGLFVRVAAFGSSALPAEDMGVAPEVGDSVLVADVGDPGSPDLIVIGVLT